MPGSCTPRPVALRPAPSLPARRAAGRSHALLMLCATLVTGCTERAESTRSAPTISHASDRAATARLFARHCVACHGEAGRGDGPAAEQLFPKPRDFVGTPFRFATTGGRRWEVLDSLTHTIREGVPRGGMPGFGGVLTPDEIDRLAMYVLELRERGGGAAAAEPIWIEPPPAYLGALVERGARLYRTHMCFTCHGEQGRGDGPDAAMLRDNMGRPVRPADFSSGLFKSGQSPESLARAIVAGVPGTPMISYAPFLAREERGGRRDMTDVWALVAYIQSLSDDSTPTSAASGELIELAPAADEAMLHDPAHPAWMGASRHLVSLRPIWQRPEETIELAIRGVQLGGEAALLLDWEDATPDIKRDVGVFPDGVAVMFALGDDVPALPMGVHVRAENDSPPVNIWHWEADRQARASRVESVAPDGRSRYASFRMPTDVDPMAQARIAPEPGTDADLLAMATAEMAGNVHSDPAVFHRAALESNALGFGTLTLQPRDRQGLLAGAVWANGRWFVLLKRELGNADADDVNLQSGRRIACSFAVWDGSKGDRDGKKLVSGWHWIACAGTQTAGAMKGGKP